jgi:hypothetical protein
MILNVTHNRPNLLDSTWIGKVLLVPEVNIIDYNFQFNSYKAAFQQSEDILMLTFLFKIL